MVRQRVRIRFGKRGNLRWIGHRDLARLAERLFRRAGLRMALSEGFHPKPRMSFPSALAVGIEGLREVMELELAQAYTAEDLRGRLESHRVPGLTFGAVEILPPASKKARIGSLTYEVPIPAERRAELVDRIARLMACKPQVLRRPGRPAPLELDRSLEDLALLDGVLRMRFGVIPQASAGPRDVLALLGLAGLEQEGAVLARTAVEVQP